MHRGGLGDRRVPLVAGVVVAEAHRVAGELCVGSDIEGGTRPVGAHRDDARGKITGGRVQQEMARSRPTDWAPTRR
ncbi:Uncharacterised protein [Mycobacteroides abscessus subsp. massiliense]|nr:Uncharacterised protein [Mycobacteroides abscessus subsp. massiliense]